LGTGHFITLSEEECLELLSTRSAGRLAWTLDDDIELMPVTHQVVGHSLVMRIAPNAPMAHIEVGQRIAFEVDELDEATRTGWDVVAHGTVQSMNSYSDDAAAVAAGAPKLTWAPGVRRNVMTISITSLSGRAVSSDEPDDQ